MNSYDLSRSWFDFCFENPDKVKPIHTAMYFFAIEHCNRLGWKDKFGFPTTMVMEAIGVKSYNTYIKILNQICDWGFIFMIQKSKNQYSSNIIALSKNDIALDKALDKALIKHSTKQSESTVQSIDSIIKQINNKQYTKEQILKLKNFIENYLEEKKYIYNKFYDEQILIADKNHNSLYKSFVDFLFKNNPTGKPLSKVLKLQSQITIETFDKWIEKYKPDKIKDCILSLENYNKKSYVHFSLTINKWLLK